MKKIIDYGVVRTYESPSSQSAINELISIVGQAIDEGWTPLGGVFIFDDHPCQAMVKYAEKETL